MDLVERLLDPTCPAATRLDGPPDRGPAVLCGVWFREMREGQIEDAEAGVLLTLYNDPTSLHAFCCGEGVPGARNSYVNCPVYERERERRDAAEKTLAAPDERNEGMFAWMEEDAGEWGMGEKGYFTGDEAFA